MEVRLDLRGGTIVPSSTTTLTPNTGHIHVFVDGAIVSMTYGKDQRIPIGDLAPGPHRLQAEFVAADHAPVRPAGHRERGLREGGPREARRARPRGGRDRVRVARWRPRSRRAPTRRSSRPTRRTAQLLEKPPSQIVAHVHRTPRPRADDRGRRGRHRARRSRPDRPSAPRAPNREVRVRLDPVPDGVYTVTWRTVSATDGHVTAGAFSFGVGVSPGDVDADRADRQPGRRPPPRARSPAGGCSTSGSSCCSAPP